MEFTTEKYEPNVADFEGANLVLRNIKSHFEKSSMWNSEEYEGRGFRNVVFIDHVCSQKDILYFPAFEFINWSLNSNRFGDVTFKLQKLLFFNMEWKMPPRLQKDCLWVTGSNLTLPIRFIFSFLDAVINHKIHPILEVSSSKFNLLQLRRMKFACF